MIKPTSTSEKALVSVLLDTTRAGARGLTRPRSAIVPHPMSMHALRDQDRSAPDGSHSEWRERH